MAQTKESLKRHRSCIQISEGCRTEEVSDSTHVTPADSLESTGRVKG